jgi:hypothetical protein
MVFIDQQCDALVGIFINEIVLLRLYGFLLISCVFAIFIDENGIFIDEN